MKWTAKIAIGGIITALSVLIMLMGWFELATYAIPAIAGALMIPVYIELGGHWSAGVYVSVSILSLLLCPNPETVVFYLFIFGYYPALKAVIERLRKWPVEWVLKLALFNAAAIAATWVSINLFGVPYDSIDGVGRWGPWILLGLGNITFVLYDIGLSRVITLYINRFQSVIRRIFR